MQRYIDQIGMTTNSQDLFLGGVRLADNLEVVNTVIRRERMETNRVISIGGGLLDGIIDEFNLLTYEEFLKEFNNPKSWLVAKYEKTYHGYLTYLDKSRKVGKIFKWHLAHLKEKSRHAHTYIVAATQSGKSELIKMMVHSDMTKGFNSIVVIEPSGKLVSEIARFKEFLQQEYADRLVYFDPALGERNDAYAVLNPFEIEWKSLLELDSATDELTRVFNQVLSEKDSGFTAQMGLIVSQMIAVLLYRKGSDFWDLIRFFDNRNNEDLINSAMKHPNISVRNFFMNRWGNEDSLLVSATGIKNRLDIISLNSAFMRTISGKSTINLQQAIESGKYILFNLSTGTLGDNMSKFIGKLILGQLQLLSMKREGRDIDKCRNVHVIVDEMQNYISHSVEQILTQSAKYKFFMTLANQYIGQEGSKDFYNAILGNAKVKFIGPAVSKSRDRMAEEMGCSSAMFNNMQVGRFYGQIHSGKPFLLHVAQNNLGQKNCMTKEEWKILEQKQLDKYYAKKTPPKDESGKKYTLDDDF